MKKLKNIVTSFKFNNKKEGKNEAEYLKLANACLMFEICTVFINKTAKLQALNYIERWFCLVVEKKKHLDLRFGLFVKLCASSNLNTTSEIEVLNAVEAWIKYKPKERSKLAVDLLKQVRLPLLSPAALNNLLREKNSFSRCKKCREYMKSAPRSVEKQFLIDPTSVNLQNRYCSQKSFDVLVCGGTSRGYVDSSSTEVRNVYRLTNRFTEAVLLTKSDFVRYPFKLAIINRFLYTITGSKCGISINSYSICTKKWSKPKKYFIGKQSVLNTCTLMGEIYVHCRNDSSSFEDISNYKRKQCFICFNPKSGKFEKRAVIAGLRIARNFCVFAGRVVVAGGFSLHQREGQLLMDMFRTRNVQGYDPSSNQWTRMPDMVYERDPRSSVALRNKLYVFSPDVSEVYDVISNKFDVIRAGQPAFLHGLCLKEAVAFGRKILAFSYTEMAFYDVESGEWSEVMKIGSRVKKEENSSFISYRCLKLPHS